MASLSKVLVLHVSLGAKIHLKTTFKGRGLFSVTYLLALFLHSVDGLGLTSSQDSTNTAIMHITVFLTSRMEDYHVLNELI